MKCTRDDSGKQLFSASECLQPQQIKGFFLAAAKKRSMSDPSSISKEVEDCLEDVIASECEQNIQQMKTGTVKILKLNGHV